MRVLAAWLIVTAAVLPGRVLAQALPLGSETVVNTFTTLNQNAPTIASPGDGSFIVVWQSDDQDGNQTGVFGQRFDKTGTAVGAEFQVNTYTTSYQFGPAIAADPSGNFVVVWNSFTQDGANGGIFGQRFNASGTKAGAEFQVNTATTMSQRNPSVAVDAKGNFVVVWESPTADGANDGILGQRFSSNGAKLGGEFLVNTYTTGQQRSATIASTPSGEFVVAWFSFGQTPFYQIFGQRFDASGAKMESEFPISGLNLADLRQPSVAMDRAGDFVVAWRSPLQDGSGYGVFARAFTPPTSPTTATPFLVNTYTTGNQDYPSVAAGKNGQFLVAWQSYPQDPNTGVYAKRIDLSGSGTATEFVLNAYTTGSQTQPRVVFDGLAWTAVWASALQDGSGNSVVRRRQNLVPERIAADAHTSGSTLSDGNGVLEPTETAILEPAWRNAGGNPVSLAGGATNFTGPGTGIYLLQDGSAVYGTVGAGATANCHDASAAHDCYLVGVAGSRPGTHWDASFIETLSSGGGQKWLVHLGDSFTDVPRSQPFYKKIETLLHTGITSGCTATTYCPGDTVNRGQMAIFIAKGIAGSAASIPDFGTLFGSSYACGQGGNSLFVDVAASDPFCKHVHSLAFQNVTLGCGTAKFCPGDTVTRDAMASFIAKAIVAPGGGDAVPLTYGPDPSTGLSYSCAAGSPNLHFTDVPASNPFCKHIHYLWAKGVVTGCSATQFCPSQTVQRDAMAKFIANGFGLELYGP